MRHPSLVVLALAIAMPVSASAQSEADRLREALRSATAQVRSLEDQRVALQARLTAAEQERDRLRKQNDAFRAQVREAERAYRQAVKDFNDRLGERDDTLKKWMEAYGEAATVARAKEAERAKLDGEVTALRGNMKTCQAKNAHLVKLGDEILRQYKAMNPLEKVLDHDPLIGWKRVEHQNTAQDFCDKILDQKVRP
jgi:chromosome segregation ATPase